ncbi:MAG: class I tRNA ligase family protein [bacterium]
MKAINPLTAGEMPIWVSDYVLSSYGTGAIMCVPAHDERDYLFAKKYGLSIKPVIMPCRIDVKNPPIKNKKTIERKTIQAIVRNPKTGKFLCLNWKKQPWTTFIVGGVNKNENIITAAKREVLEETGYKNLKLIRKLGIEVQAEYYAAHKNENRKAYATAILFELINEEQDNISKEEKEKHKVTWLDLENINPNNFNCSELDLWLFWINSGYDYYVGNGIIINSGKLNGLEWPRDAKKIISQIPNSKLQTQYKLRDWLISRQRYWGAPIPIIYCRKCWEIKNQKSKIKINEVVIDGKEYTTIPVPEKDLPVELPDDVDFLPTGESPLAKSKSFYSVKCPKCGGNAKRENDTMDTFVDSSWYFLRYTDPQNTKQPFSKDKIKKWLPVDLYIGGAEHAVMHLLYSRFMIKALKDMGYIEFDEPFLKLRNQGLVLAQDGRKMSKSLGNVINPDKIIVKYGADTLRMYEMFIGPLEDAAPWDTKGIIGIKRFLDRVWQIDQKITNKLKSRVDLDKTIQKVTNDIENLRFNTAISSMMEYVNQIYKIGIDRDSLKDFLIILFPFAPHLSSELWDELDFGGHVYEQKWPEIGKIQKEKEGLVVIQVNGKIRGKIIVPTTYTEKEVLELAQKEKNVTKYLKNKKIKKHIYIPSKILNIVI